MVNENWVARDLAHIWHPCTQMKDFIDCPPLVIHRAQGSYLYTDRGMLIDSISSWWCKSLGHGHPRVIDAIQQQLKQFEHVIGANSTYPNLVMLGEELATICQQQHTFFASDGSSAVEIALKLALHAHQLQGASHKKEFIALSNAYHGETLATIQVSDLAQYKKPYVQAEPRCHFLQNLPYVSSQHDPLWAQCESIWPKFEAQLHALKDTVCAILVEPILQGAGGMTCYSADFLKRLAAFAKAHNIYLIADEIMTGFGRTGEWLASDHAQVQADLICLSKGLTSGSLPLSCVVINNAIYELFYADFSTGKSFLHSHTYSCHALAVAAALATIHTIREEHLIENARALGHIMQQQLTDIAAISQKLTNIRSIGAWVAADLVEPPHPRIDVQIYQAALQRGALLRPLGKTLYWLPPLNTATETIAQLAEITLNSIEAAYHSC